MARGKISGIELNHKRNPYTKVVYRNLNELVKNNTEKEMVDGLADLNYELEPHIYRTLFVRSTLSVVKFVKFMLASDQNSFTITITDEEKKLLLDFESKKKVDTK